MRHSTILFALLSSLAVGSTACKARECAEGTVDRNGVCEPATGRPPGAECGPFTELQGDVCVPTFPPTECDLATTTPTIDPATGVVTCVGSVEDFCAPIACPAGTTANKLTVCGQLYDFQDNTKFQDGTALDGVHCDPASPATSGPCALQIAAYDALAFGTNPQTAPKLPVRDVHIDSCGRYRLTDIDVNGTSTYIALGFNDAGGNPTGVTVPVAIATSKPSERYVKNFVGWIVKPSTALGWETGGPPLSDGIYAGVFRQHKTGTGDPFAAQAGVTFTKNDAPEPANDHYFEMDELTHQTIDMNATMTGANGTVLFAGAPVADGDIYAGQGGLGPGCRWEPHAAASPMGTVFIQVHRKIDIAGMTCND